MPFIVHSLGNLAYGVWALLMSLTGYMGLLEVGVMSATARYVNYHLERNEPEEVSYVVNTSLVFYLSIGVVLLIVSGMIGISFDRLFPKISVEFYREAQIILPILAVNIVFGLVAGTFRQVLVSKDRFDLQNLADLLILGIRSGGVYLALSSGYGISSLAVIHVCANMLGCFFLFALICWKGPQVNYGPKYFKFKSLRLLINFGIFAFIGDTGDQFIYYTAFLVIGILIGGEAVAFYNIGFVLIDYGRKLIGQATRVFLPDILKLGSVGMQGELRWLLVKMTRVSMFFGVPILVGFITLGDEFIRLWMGAEYSVSARVLLVLSIAQFGALSSNGFMSVLLATGNVKARAFIRIIEAVINLLLSIGLVRMLHLGVMGVAVGTLFPMLLISGVVLPWFGCKLINLEFTEFMKKTFLRWFSAGMIFLIVCLGVASLPLRASWDIFITKTVALGILYIPIGLYLSLDRADRKKIWEMIQDFVKMLQVRVKYWKMVRVGSKVE